MVAVVGSAIFGLHEPARRGDAENVQVVFDAATDEHAAVAAEAIGVQARGSAGQGGQSRTRPVRAGPARVDVGENVRGRPDNRGGRRRRRYWSFSVPVRAATVGSAIVAAQAAELAIGQDAEHPAAVELPVVAGADRAEPTVAALARIDGQRRKRRGRQHGIVRIPDAAAGATEDVEAGPARSDHHRGSLGVGRAGRHVGREGRSAECRDSGQGEQYLLHFESLSVNAYLMT